MQNVIVFAALGILALVALLIVRELLRKKLPVVDVVKVVLVPAEPLPKALASTDEDDDMTQLKAIPAPASLNLDDGDMTFSETHANVMFELNANNEEPTNPKKLFIVDGAAQSDVGKRRKRNEDSYLLANTHGLYAVADGMGGYAGGDVASSLAVRQIAKIFEDSIFPAPRKPDPTCPKAASELIGAIEAANDTVWKQSKKREEFEGMGTTLVAARFLERKRRVYIAHVGDSRCYRLRAGKLRQITVDHTLAAKGVQGPVGAHIRRAVGVNDRVYVDITCDVPEPSDRYVFCSDGLTKMLSDETLEKMISDRGVSPQELAQQLVDAANKAGGKDNTTVIVTDVLEESSEVPPARSSGIEFGGAASLEPQLEAASA